MTQNLVHELWKDPDGCTGVCLAGPMGDGARREIIHSDAKLIWVFEGNSHFETMTKYYNYMDWGEYSTDFPDDKDRYPDDWFKCQADTKETWQQFHQEKLKNG